MGTKVRAVPSGLGSEGPGCPYNQDIMFLSADIDFIPAKINFTSTGGYSLSFLDVIQDP